MKNNDSNLENHNSGGNLFMANFIATNEEYKLTTPEMKYKRIDCEKGYLTNQTEIDNYKTYQKKDIVSNNMLGDYNDKGDYVLSESLLDSLVKINKVIINNYNNIYFLKSNHSFEFKGNLQFCVVIKENKTKTTHTATAILKLLENVNRIGGYIQNTNSFVVATFTDDFASSFYQKIKKVFNIFEINEHVGQEKDNIIDLINKRIALMQELNNSSAKYLYEIEKGYFEARIQILKDMNMEDVFIYFQALQEKTSVFLQPTSPNYYRFLNELLDDALEHQVLIQPSFLADYNRIMLPVASKYNQDIISVYNAETDKAKLQVLNKSNSPNKTVGKSKGNGGGTQTKGGGSSGKGGPKKSKEKSSGGNSPKASSEPAKKPAKEEEKPKDDTIKNEQSSSFYSKHGGTRGPVPKVNVDSMYKNGPSLVQEEKVLTTYEKMDIKIKTNPTRQDEIEK